MVKGLATVIYHVADLNRAKAWYAAAFEQQPVLRSAVLCWLQCRWLRVGARSESGGDHCRRWRRPRVLACGRIESAVQHFISVGATAIAPIQDVGEGIKVATVAIRLAIRSA